MREVLIIAGTVLRMQLQVIKRLGYRNCQTNDVFILDEIATETDSETETDKVGSIVMCRTVHTAQRQSLRLNDVIVSVSVLASVWSM